MKYEKKGQNLIEKVQRRKKRTRSVVRKLKSEFEELVENFDSRRETSEYSNELYEKIEQQIDG